MPPRNIYTITTATGDPGYIYGGDAEDAWYVSHVDGRGWIGTGVISWPAVAAAAIRLPWLPDRDGLRRAIDAEMHRRLDARLLAYDAATGAV